MFFTRCFGLRRFLNVKSKVLPIVSLRAYVGTIDLSDNVVQKYLRHLITEYNDLQSRTKLAQMERFRLNEITPIVKVLAERVILHENIDSLKELNKQEKKDGEMLKQIKEEAEIYLSRLNEVDNELLDALLETNYTQGSVIVEVTAGAGGQEAMLFAAELLQMYQGYGQHHNWEVTLDNIDKSDIGGLRKGSLLIEGLGVPELMRLEAGVHRVQRVPDTDRSGRIHTSTATVAVLPQASELDITIPDRDVHIETKRASGAGGQHVNTTDSMVRLTHLPTGLIVECQEGRSQIKNKQIAMQKLRTILLNKQIEKQSNKINAERRSQVGSGERNEKIRTYNYPQDRVTEHRPGGASVNNLRGFLAGGPALREMQETVLRQLRYQVLLREMESVQEKAKN